MDQLVAGCIVDNVNKLFRVRSTPSPRRSCPRPASRLGASRCLPEHGLCRLTGQSQCGQQASQLILSIPVVGLSLAPGPVVLVPIVPRDAHGSALLEDPQLLFF